MQDSQRILDSIFLSYNKILIRLKQENKYTKNNKEITHKNLRTAVNIMLKKHPTCFRYESNKNIYVSSKGIELLCKNCFKQKYLEILENYKMELTEEYIKVGYPYDNFFGKNKKRC